MKNDPETITVWHGLFLAEFFCLLVALATTVLPSKTGSTTGISGHFFDEPTFLQEFWVNLVVIHAMLVLLAGGIAAWCRMTGAHRSATPEEES